MTDPDSTPEFVPPEDEDPVAIGPEHVGQFPTLIVDAITKAMVARAAAWEEDVAAAFRKWGDMRGLIDRAARIEVVDPRNPSGVTFEGVGKEFSLVTERTILLADTAYYGTRDQGPPDLARHERVFEGRTYTVALLHRDEASKIRAQAYGPGTATMAVPDEDEVDPPRPANADEFDRLADRLYWELGEQTGGPLHVQLEDGNTDGLIGEAGRHHRRVMAAAAERIEAGDVPTEPSHYTARDAVGDTAYYYSGRYGCTRAQGLDILRCCIAILDLTLEWTQAEVDVVHGPWSERTYAKISARNQAIRDMS